MNGAIAAIYKDKEQVGGLLDWTMTIVKNDGSDGVNKTQKVIKRVFTASKSWHFTDAEMPVMIAFYKFEDGALFQVHREQCDVTFRGDRDVVTSKPVDIDSWVAS